MQTYSYEYYHSKGHLFDNYHDIVTLCQSFRLLRILRENEQLQRRLQ